MTKPTLRKSDWLRAGLLATTILFPGLARAQTATPTAVMPTDDVYSTLAQNPALISLLPKSGPSNFSNLTVVGDSYADFGNLAHFFGSSFPSFYYPTGRFSNALNVIDGIQYGLGLPTSQVANYAVGGAQSGATNVYPGLPGVAQEVQSFLATSPHLSKTSLVDITTTGGNDLFSLSPAASSSQIQTVASAVAATEVQTIQQFINVGARNFVLLAPAGISYLPAFNPGGVGDGLGPIPNYSVYNSVGGQYSAQTFLDLEKDLVPLAKSGIRIFYFDQGALNRMVATNPTAYGFTNASVACLGVPACQAAPLVQQDQYFSWDGLHLTTAGYLLVASYEINQINAPNTIAPQANLAQSRQADIDGLIQGHLDLDRLQAPDPSAPKLSFYIQPLGNSGDERDKLWADGFSYGSIGGLVGGDYRLNPRLTVGLAAAATTGNADLDAPGTLVADDHYQVMGYGSFHGSHWFADGDLSFGYNVLRLHRPGVLDERIEGSTRGTTVAVTTKAGYIADLGPLKAGAIAALNYSSSEINGYTESGDPLLTMQVNGQTLASTIASVGLELSCACTRRITPFLDATANNYLGSRSRTVVTTQTSTPLLPVETPLQPYQASTYGQFTGGVVAIITPAIKLVLQGTTMPGSYAISGGLQSVF